MTTMILSDRPVSRRSAERYLRGKNGRMTIEVDADGSPPRKLVTMEAVHGHDVILTIDTNLQKVAMDSLTYNIERIRNDKGAQLRGRLRRVCSGAGCQLGSGAGDGEATRVLIRRYTGGLENTEAQQMIIED